MKEFRVKMNRYLFIILLLLCGCYNMMAQDMWDNLATSEYRIDTTDIKALRVEVDNLSFFHDNEYSGKLSRVTLCQACGFNLNSHTILSSRLVWRSACMHLSLMAPTNTHAMPITILAPGKAINISQEPIYFPGLELKHNSNT